LPRKNFVIENLISMRMRLPEQRVSQLRTEQSLELVTQAQDLKVVNYFLLQNTPSQLQDQITPLVEVSGHTQVDKERALLNSYMLIFLEGLHQPQHIK
jgi:hypothetical protein